MHETDTGEHQHGTACLGNDTSHQIVGGGAHGAPRPSRINTRSSFRPRPFEQAR